MSNEAKAVTPVTLEKLDVKASNADIVATLNILIDRVNAIKVRDRGPKSERSMTDQDAFEVKFGKLAKAAHKEAAAELGLSYGQVYSARGGYTFTHIDKNWKAS